MKSVIEFLLLKLVLVVVVPQESKVALQSKHPSYEEYAPIWETMRDFIAGPMRVRERGEALGERSEQRREEQPRGHQCRTRN